MLVGIFIANRLFMRRSDPKLTAKIYTDASQLPIADAVNRLLWVENAIAPQKLDSDGHSRSRVGMSETECEVVQGVNNESDRRGLSRMVKWWKLW